MTCTNHSLSSTHAHGILHEYCHVVKHRARVMKTSDSLRPALFPPADVKFCHLNRKCLCISYPLTFTVQIA